MTLRRARRRHPDLSNHPGHDPRPRPLLPVHPRPVPKRALDGPEPRARAPADRRIRHPRRRRDPAHPGATARRESRSPATSSASCAALGYRARLRVLTPSRFGAALTDYRNPPQMDTNSWTAMCRRPRTGSRSSSAAPPGVPAAAAQRCAFCDPAVDRIAAPPPNSSPPTRSPPTGCGHAPTATSPTSRRGSRPSPQPRPTSSSARVGNYQYVPTIGALLDQLWVR